MSIPTGIRNLATLEIAAGQGQLEEVERLLAAGAVVEESGPGDKSPNRALHEAMRGGHMKVANTLNGCWVRHSE